MKINTLQKLYVHSLKDAFSAEKQIVKAFPKMIKAVKSPELKASFQKHLDESQEHVRRLEGIFEMLSMSAGRQKCKSTEGMLLEIEEFMENTESNSDVMDVGLIAAVQLIEHSEIASYGSLVQFAKMLGDNEVVKILNKTLKEEKDVDERLTMISKNIMGKAAAEQKRRGSEPQQPSM